MRGFGNNTYRSSSEINKIKIIQVFFGWKDETRWWDGDMILSIIFIFEALTEHLDQRRQRAFSTSNFLPSKHRHWHGSADNSFLRTAEISLAPQGRGSCKSKWRSCSPTTSGSESMPVFLRLENEVTRARLGTSTGQTIFPIRRTSILFLLLYRCFTMLRYIETVMVKGHKVNDTLTSYVIKCC